MEMVTVGWLEVLVQDDVLTTVVFDLVCLAEVVVDPEAEVDTEDVVEDVDVDAVYVGVQPGTVEVPFSAESPPEPS